MKNGGDPSGQYLLNQMTLEKANEIESPPLKVSDPAYAGGDLGGCFPGKL